MLTEKDIVLDIISNLSDEEVEFIRSIPYSDVILLHHTAGQWIRNKYGLWNRPWVSEIEDGIDFSPNHPDAVSMRIIELVHERCHAA